MLVPMDQPEPRGLQISAAPSGGVVIRSELDFTAVQRVVPNLREVAGNAAEINARLVVWAGPYEIFMSLKPIIDTTAAVVGGVVDVAALLTLFVRRHPNLPITIHIEESKSVLHQTRTVTITGRELSAVEADVVNRFFADHNDDPDDKIGGSNQAV